MQKGAWERGLLWELGATTTVARARCRWSPTRGPRRLVQRRCRSDGGVRPPSVATGQAGKRGTGQLAQPGPARLGRGIVRPALVGSQPQPAPPSLGRVVDPPRSSGSLVVLSFVRRAQVLACLLAGWLAMVVGLGFCNQTLASPRIARSRRPSSRNWTCRRARHLQRLLWHKIFKPERVVARKAVEYSVRTS